MNPRIPSILLIVLPLSLLWSCRPSPERAQADINQLEQSLFSDSLGLLDKARADALIAQYLEYAERFPEDEMSPAYLYNAADMMMNLSGGAKAMELLTRLQEEYPQYEKVPTALFLQAFIAENHLNDLPRAEALYKAYIERYPEGEFADDARACLLHLGKSPEEMIKAFEEAMQQADSTNGMDTLATISQ